MSVASRLPPEILYKIFASLEGQSVIRCRAVCKSWKSAVDGLGDFHWKQICDNALMNRVYERVHSKSCISWFDTYRAVNSWSNIKSAKMECRQLPSVETVQRFKVLPNRVIAVLINSGPEDRGGGGYWGHSDTIAYYNMDTLEELSREKYETTFCDYDENEHLIVLRCSNRELHVIQKANKKKVVVGKVYQSDPYHIGQFGLFGKKVYFQNENAMIHLSKLKETKKGSTILRTATLKAFDEDYDLFEEYVIAFGYQDDHMTMLTAEGNAYMYRDQDLEMLSKFRWHSFDIIGELMEYGFEWTSQPIYHWLMGSFEAKMLGISELDHLCFCLHAKTTVTGAHKKIQLHYMPFKNHLGLGLYKKKPTRTVAVDTIAKKTNKTYEVTQVDVVESTDHHLVIALIGGSLTFLKFGFGEGSCISMPPSLKRRASPRMTPKSKAKKIAKKPKATTVKLKAEAKNAKAQKVPAQTTNRYNTRSAKNN